MAQLLAKGGVGDIVGTEREADLTIASSNLIAATALPTT
jgi:hypothetical protein